MRNYGIDLYSVDEMDITLMTTLVTANFKGLKPVDSNTRKALDVVRVDRNLISHSGKKEKPNELYLRGLLDLCHLKSFVEAVDKSKESIEDEPRLSYIRKYIERIDRLQKTLDEERIDLIQSIKEMEKDIHMILESSDPRYSWKQIYRLYLDRYCKLETCPQKLDEFIVRASDMGVSEAHREAADFFLRSKDIKEAERRLIMAYHSSNDLSVRDINFLLIGINRIILQSSSIPDDLISIITELREKGYPIERNGNGLFDLLDLQ